MGANDLNDKIHRIESSVAVFQKGLYHLFLLCKRKEIDLFSDIVRKYQALFQLCTTHYLLDFTASINPKKIPNRLKKLCMDQNNPTGEELDPAAVVTHSIFENGNWPTIQPGSQLYTTSKASVGLISRVSEARHNLIYRPFLLQKSNVHWEDCTLIDLIHDVPSTSDILKVYEQFIEAVLNRQLVEISLRKTALGNVNNLIDIASITDDSQIWADHFIRHQFLPFEDINSARPTETLLISYARLLNPSDERLLNDLRKFRNELLQVQKITELVVFDPSWNIGNI
jgi:hypothetical protein